MNKKIIALLLTALVAVTGCQSKEQAKAPSEKQLESSEDKSAALKEAFGEYIIEPNEALKTIFSKSWDVTGTEDVYVLKTDGTGTKNEEAFTYECGFDAENNIILKFIMEGKDEGVTYVVTSDGTGHGLNLESSEAGVSMNLFPTNMTLLETSDERAAALVGSWKDSNENEYILEETGKLLIKGKDAQTPGTWCAVEKEEEGVLAVNLLVEGGSLEFEYEVQEEGNTLALYNRGAETWYYWYRS